MSSEEAKIDEDKKEERKAEVEEVTIVVEAKPEEPKVEEPKPDEPKPEEVKPEEPKVEEPKVDEDKKEERKAEVEEVKPEQPKVDEVKPDVVISGPVSPPDPQAVELARLIDGKIDWKNPVPACMILATAVEQFVMISDERKTELIQGALNHAAENLPGVEKTAALFFVKEVVPHVVRAAHHASLSPIIHRIEALGCWSWFSWKK